MDGSLLAGRVGLRLAVLLVLLWGWSGAQRVATDAPPAEQAAVQATLMPPSGILTHHGDVVRPAARHDQGNRHRSAPAAMLAAALVGALAATSRREPVFCSTCLEGRLLALLPRAPPFLRP